MATQTRNISPNVLDAATGKKLAPLYRITVCAGLYKWQNGAGATIARIVKNTDQAGYTVTITTSIGTHECWARTLEDAASDVETWYVYFAQFANVEAYDAAQGIKGAVYIDQANIDRLAGNAPQSAQDAPSTTEESPALPEHIICPDCGAMVLAVHWLKVNGVRYCEYHGGLRMAEAEEEGPPTRTIVAPVEGQPAPAVSFVNALGMRYEVPAATIAQYSAIASTWMHTNIADSLFPQPQQTPPPEPTEAPQSDDPAPAVPAGPLAIVRGRHPHYVLVQLLGPGTPMRIPARLVAGSEYVGALHGSRGTQYVERNTIQSVGVTRQQFDALVAMQEAQHAQLAALKIQQNAELQAYLDTLPSGAIHSDLTL